MTLNKVDWLANLIWAVTAQLISGLIDWVSNVYYVVLGSQ